MFKVESYKKGILLSTIFNFFNKALLFLSGILVAYFYGINQETDIFFYIFSSLTILSGFVMNINSTVIVPESMLIRNKYGEEKAMQFINFFIFAYSAIAVIFLAIISISPISFFSIVSSFKEDQLIAHKFLLYLALPLFGLICIITLLSDVLCSYKFFTIPMLVGITNGIISIIAIVLFYHKGIQSAFCALGISYLTNLTLLIYLLKRHLRWRFNLIKINIDKRVWKNLGFAQLSNLTSTLSLYVPIYVLSGSSIGVITSLTFAQQIAALPGALLTNQFSSVAGIKFNELYSQNNFPEINRVFTLTTNFLIFLVLPISAIFFLFSSEIIGFLFMWKSSPFNEIENASMFLKYLGLSLPMLVINTLFARLFMASHKIKESFYYQTTMNILLIFSVYYSVRSVGPIGYPLSTLSVNLLNILGCYLLQKRYFNMINYPEVLKSFLFYTIINLMIAFAVYLTIKYISIESDFLNLTVGSLIYGSLITIIAIIFKLNETINIFMRQFFQKVRYR